MKDTTPKQALAIAAQRVALRLEFDVNLALANLEQSLIMIAYCLQTKRRGFDGIQAFSQKGS
jgi:hypothetical protein